MSQFVRPRGVWGRLAGWEMSLRPSNRRRNVWAVDMLDIRPADRVLEIGFGPGIALRELSRRATHGRVYGLDHSAEMVRQASRRNAALIRAGRVVLRHGSADDLPGFDEPLDAVLAVNNLGMWADADASLKRLGGLMRDSGRIAIVSQPRCPGATRQTTARAGDEIAERLGRAGFVNVRRETLELSPPAVCVLGDAAN